MSPRHKFRRRLQYLAYSLTMLGFLFGLIHVFGLGVHYRFPSDSLNQLTFAVVFLLPLFAFPISLVSDSDTLRALGAAIFPFTVPVSIVGLLVVGVYTGAREVESEIRVEDRYLVAYTTNHRGALGDYGLEVRQETPWLLGLREIRTFSFGREGLHFESFTATHGNCAELKYYTLANEDNVPTQRFHTREFCLYSDD